MTNDTILAMGRHLFGKKPKKNIPIRKAEANSGMLIELLEARKEARCAKTARENKEPGIRNCEACPYGVLAIDTYDNSQRHSCALEVVIHNERW